MSSRLVASDKSKPPLLQITIPVWGRLSAHVSEAPEKIGEFENRRLYVSFIAFVAGADTVQFSYTFYLGESLVGQA
jgi:hypothetical protein